MIGIGLDQRLSIKNYLRESQLFLSRAIVAAAIVILLLLVLAVLALMVWKPALGQ